MRTKMKLLSLICLSSLLSLNVWAERVRIQLYERPVEDGIPSKFSLSLPPTVSYEDAVLYLESPFPVCVQVTLKDAEENVVSSESICISAQGSAIQLDYLPGGTYKIEIETEEAVFFGYLSL